MTHKGLLLKLLQAVRGKRFISLEVRGSVCRIFTYAKWDAPALSKFRFDTQQGL